jgi:hypothetical protein
MGYTLLGEKEKRRKKLKDKKSKKIKRDAGYERINVGSSKLVRKTSRGQRRFAPTPRA